MLAAISWPYPGPRSLYRWKHLDLKCVLVSLNVPPDYGHRLIRSRLTQRHLGWGKLVVGFVQTSENRSVSAPKIITPLIW